jgi:hypothetical protein
MATEAARPNWLGWSLLALLLFFGLQWWKRNHPKADVRTFDSSYTE